MKKSQTHFNLLPNEKESLKDVAWMNKMSVSDFIRYALKCQGWSYVNILDTKSQTFLCCTSS